MTGSFPVINASTISASQSAQEFCYQIETKLSSIKNGASHYEILEVERNATPAQINSAYRQQVQKFSAQSHEDLARFGLDLRIQLGDILVALRRAADTLSNPTEREGYERQQQHKLRRPAGNYRTTEFAPPNMPSIANTPPSPPSRVQK